MFLVGSINFPTELTVNLFCIYFFTNTNFMQEYQSHPLMSMDYSLRKG